MELTLRQVQKFVESRKFVLYSGLTFVVGGVAAIAAAIIMLPTEYETLRALGMAIPNILALMFVGIGLASYGIGLVAGQMGGAP